MRKAAQAVLAGALDREVIAVSGELAVLQVLPVHRDLTELPEPMERREWTEKLSFSKLPDQVHLVHSKIKTRTLRSVLQSQLTSLNQWACIPCDISEKANEVFELLTGEALERPAEHPFTGLAFINADGLPFQWSFCLGPKARSVRFLCEAGKPWTSPQERLEFACKQLKKTFELLGVPNPGWLWDTVFTTILPGKQDWPPHWRSALWTGVGISQQGIMIKPYLNLNRGTCQERWKRIGWVLKLLNRPNALSQLCEISSKTSKDSWPVGMAVDVRPDGKPGRIKIYFVSGTVKTDWLEKWYTATGSCHEAPMVRRMLDLFPICGTARYPEKSFIVSLEFHKEDTGASLKTDLALNRWMNNDQDIVRGIHQLLHVMESDTTELDSMLQVLGIPVTSDSKVSHLRFVGFGFEPGGENHLNIYIEPPIEVKKPFWKQVSILNSVDIQTSLRNGVDYIFSNRTNQYWKDFLLPVGDSDQWTTAYVLWQLGLLPLKLLNLYDFEIRESLTWLAQVGAQRNGWGYNATTELDSDSTSIAILALKAFNRDVSATAYDFIQLCQTTEGGMATYLPGNMSAGSWVSGVTDITPVALDACGPRMNYDDKTKSIHFLNNSQLSDGTWPSFWWLSRLYPTSKVLTVLPRYSKILKEKQLRNTLLGFHPVGAFETALLILCLLDLNLHRNATPLIKELLNDQLETGCWEASAFLRLTLKEVSEPWKHIDAGTTFKDVNSLFTTSTVLSALAQYQEKI
jgi:hypothetical protein